MSYIKTLHYKAHMRRISLAFLVIVFVGAIWNGIPETYASYEQLDANVLESPLAPQQQLKGESELPWLFAVYIITWAAFFGYVFVMSRRQREMGREIEALKRAVADRQRQEAQAEQESRGGS